MKKILLVNIIVFIVLFTVLDVIFYFKQGEIEKRPIKEYKFFNFPRELSLENIHFRKSAGEQYNSKSILLIGCSFAYSMGLEDEEAFHYKLAEYSKRPIINKAMCAGGPFETLWLFKQDNFYKDIKEPEYVIYLFIENHFSRMQSVIYSLMSPMMKPMYETDENYDIKEKPFKNKYLLLSHLYKYYYYKKYTLNYEIRKESEFVNVMIALNKLIKKHWKNTKLIVLRFDEANVRTPFLFSNKSIEKFSENRIIYLDADELVFGNTGECMTGDIYMQEDQHPSAYAFDILSAKLAEKIKELDSEN